MIKIGQVFYTNQKDSEWKIWHEIMNIDGDNIIISNYGKDTTPVDVVMTKKEIAYSIRKGLLIQA